MKRYQIIIIMFLCCFLFGCQFEENSQIGIEDHIYVEKEFEDSWLEKCDDGRSYLQLVLDGGYHYQTNKDYLNIFFDDGGKIELYNYSIKKDRMIISGEFIAENTIRLIHPNLDNIISEGVLMHELGHYFDYKYQFSSSDEFKNLFDKYNEDIDNEFNDISQVDESEFFAELFKAYTGSSAIQLPVVLKDYMDKICRKILENE